MTRIESYLYGEAGASAAEYALLLAILGAAVAIASITLGNAISNAVTRASNCISSFTAVNCS